MRKLCLLLIVGLIVALIPISVLAGFSGGGDINLMTRLEVSNNGSDWYNYSAETNSGLQTLQVHPGDTVTFRIKVWNLGNSAANNIALSATTTNPQYIQTANIFDGSATTNQDLDGDGYDYAVTSFDSAAGTGTFLLDEADTGTVEAGTTNNEGGTYTTQISSSTPDQTLIEVTMKITAASEVRGEDQTNNINLLDRAYADDEGTTIAKILVVNQPATALPSTGKSPQTESNSTATLTATALVGIVAGYIILRNRRQKSKSKI